MKRIKTAAAQAALAMLLACTAAQAEEADVQAWNLHGQATYVWQTKPAFRSAYEGDNSLSALREKSYSFTSTAALGVRGWQGAEFYLNAELVQGVALSGLTGLGGLTNGELQKTAGSKPVLYLARAFLRQTWALGGESEKVDSGFNQLAGSQASRRLVLTVGTLAVSDLFDPSRYAHDARGQFINWALLTHGHFDFAADSRGYSQGAALEWVSDDWTLRGARFAVPRESNGLKLDTRLATVYGDQLELERRHSLGQREGAVRLLLFRNVARMAGFDEALRAAPPGAVPRLDTVRRLQSKQGWGLAADQELAESVGGFVRLGSHDGRTEPYSFSAIDNAFSAGLVWSGSAWRRAEDQLGVALASNGLSGAHQRYLAAGGTDFFIGDGRLNYGRETIVEAYYSAALAPALRLSFDFQQIANPAYNRDRGPVRTFALRLHAEL